MPYLPNIPIATQTLKSSQPQILGNFQTLNSVYGVDHYDYTVTGANMGHHKNVTFNKTEPAPSPAAGYVSIYGKDVAGSSELFVKHDGSPTEYQLTSGGNTNITNSTGFTPISAKVTVQMDFPAVSVNPTITILNQSNVASVVLSGSPNFLVTFTTPLSSAAYYPMISFGLPQNVLSSAEAPSMLNTVPLTTSCLFHLPIDPGHPTAFTAYVNLLIFGP